MKEQDKTREKKKKKQLMTQVNNLLKNSKYN